MGYSTEIFIPEPCQGVLCAICHDVLKDAKAFNCGHTFCADCVDDINNNNTIASHDGPAYPPSHRDATCPSCRAVITSSIPNYVVRDIIDSLTVKCLHGTNNNNNLIDDFVDNNNNREVCTWTGCVQDLQTHDKTCKYKLVTCTAEGCTHSCQRKDMIAHTSDIDVKFRHVELKCESKLKAMEDKYEGKMQSLQNDFDRELAAHDRHLATHYESKMQTLQHELNRRLEGVQDSRLESALEFVGSQLKAHDEHIAEAWDQRKKLEAKIQSLQNDLDRELAAYDRNLASNYGTKIQLLQLNVAAQKIRIQTVEQKLGIEGGDSSNTFCRNKANP